jgi:hypothetical protein
MALSIALAEITMRTEHQTALDVWLRGVLTHEFGAAESEALPEELLQLLPQDEDNGAV